MLGITLAPEQIRAAPPEVRHCLEQQLALTFGLPHAAAPAPMPPHTALRRASGDAEATLYGLDAQGHCFVADATSRSILAVWQGMVMNGAVAPPANAPAMPEAPMGGQP